ncbi:hypothetical protein [Ferrimonas marina]|uniref:Uncharacterized protein n=1 Tax=Ferrimonas marina TaxID=299255 RepID=A0A1M5RJC8_9GAMM|nr:hypothetical protein [Ferrimonas marina]SHH26482.1 hypothetical protein SAMN02745129_1650 [Ferrimonas marina]
MLGLRILLLSLVIGLSGLVGVAVSEPQQSVTTLNLVVVESPVQDEISEPLGFASPSSSSDWLRASCDRLSTAFLGSNRQQRPEYAVAYELPVPVPQQYLPGYIEPLPISQQWPLETHSNPARLGGWKESNQLYRLLALQHPTLA